MSQLPLVTSCDGCGACCSELGHPPFFWQAANGATIDPHWETVPQHLKNALEEYLDSLDVVDIGEPCIWFDKAQKKCSHYDYRPQICRDFEMGSADCILKRIDLANAAEAS